MKSIIPSIAAVFAMALLTTVGPAQETSPVGKLKLHAIFNSNMVLQRGKPIVIWGWAKPGDSVSLQLGKDKADAKVTANKGLTKEFSSQWNDDGQARLNYRRTEEAKRALEIIQRVPTLDKPKP